MKLTSEQFILLEKTYYQHFSNDIPVEIFQDYKSIIKNKELLRYASPDQRILNNILDVAIGKMKHKQRFQKITFIKLIRCQCENIQVDSTTGDKLFYIFKSLISTVNDKISWSLSVTIKDKVISQENINWLIENYEISEHIQNRLLRYPFPNKAITKWANQRLKKKDLNERLSELIGLKLNFDTNFSCKDKTKLVWGIHFSKLSEELKKELLLKHVTTENLEYVLEICDRNSFTDIIHNLYHSNLNM
ncbi:hypothetical protein [Myroides odoratimimus]|uniref:hypothetical protein n=1 Tax=Myroides odoratimimus TaxID=76832 RepID=UPI002DB8D0D4|nr:hypothetical protein [Myroides odoratimimus]MEC4036912.1 hypothetical protein [Myroides odoratimimus]